MADIVRSTSPTDGNPARLPNRMKTSPTMCARWLAALFATSLTAQDWTDEQLVAAVPGFQSKVLGERLAQIGRLLPERGRMMNAMAARIHGDHREYRIKVDKLLEELGDPRWQVREAAERTLVEIGSRAFSVIEQRKLKADFPEQQIRCARVLDALVAKGKEQEERELALLRGLVATALYCEPEPRLLRALRSALGHTEAAVAEGALRALGRLGGDDDVDAVAQMVTYKNGVHRLGALAALARMQSPRAAELVRKLLAVTPVSDGLLAGITPTRTEAVAMVRTLHGRDDAGAAALLDELARHPDPVLGGLAKTKAPTTGKPVKVVFSLPDPIQVPGRTGGFFGDSHRVDGAFPDLPSAELSLSDSDTLDFPDHAMQPATGARVFLNQGSLVCGDVLRIDDRSVVVRSAVFGEVTLSRSEVQGIAFDPTLDRLVGGSTEHDRVRLRSGELLDGKLQHADATGLQATDKAGGERKLAIGEVAGVLFTRPRTSEPDPTSYTRFDLVTGERLIGFLGDSSPDHFAVTVPLLGSAALPLTQLVHVELGVGGGAMWGFTLIADYSDNRIVEVDDQGRVVFVLEEIFGAWDAECLDNGNLLITEFAVSRVQEVDRKGKTVWAFESLKNPYDADRLPNGNTLIADTFGSRVIEVDRDGKIVWSFAKDIRPFDCDRLPNGNTLITDVLKERVIEVSPSGEVVWEIKGMPQAHDADRLQNGNTLVTLRNKGEVLEIDREGKVVFLLQGLSSPSDADRLPNGNTLVAENTCAREFDRRGNQVWKQDMTWAVEVNRY
jgi:hypothetical protein